MACQSQLPMVHYSTYTNSRMPPLPVATVAGCDTLALPSRYASPPPSLCFATCYPSRVEASCHELRRLPVGYSIEIKSSLEGDGIFHPQPAVFLNLVVAELAAAQVLARTTILSFDARILQLTHQQYPDLATSLLLEEDLDWLQQLQALGFEPTTLGPDFRADTPTSVQALRTSFPSIQLVPWTVNAVADMSRIMLLKPEGITTDYPNRLLDLL